MAKPGDSFVKLILQDGSPEYSQYLATVSSVIRDPKQIGHLLSGEETNDLFLLELERATPRLVQFFGILRSAKFNAKVAEEVLLGFLLPLIGKLHNAIGLAHIVQILVSGLPIGLACPNLKLRWFAQAFVTRDGL